MQSNLEAESDQSIFEEEITATFDGVIGQVENLIFSNQLVAKVNMTIETGNFEIDIDNFYNCGNRINLSRNRTVVLFLLGDDDIDSKIYHCDEDQIDSVFFI